jgi:hypothetical protein
MLHLIIMEDVEQFGGFLRGGVCRLLPAAFRRRVRWRWRLCWR